MKLGQLFENLDTFPHNDLLGLVTKRREARDADLARRASDIALEGEKKTAKRSSKKSKKADAITLSPVEAALLAKAGITTTEIKRARKA